MRTRLPRACAFRALCCACRPRQGGYWLLAVLAPDPGGCLVAVRLTVHPGERFAVLSRIRRQGRGRLGIQAAPPGKLWRLRVQRLRRAPSGARQRALSSSGRSCWARGGRCTNFVSFYLS